MFWPSEIEDSAEDLQTDRGGAFSVDTAAAAMHTYAGIGCYPWDVPPADGAGPSV
jgi:hypothetical protein